MAAGAAEVSGKVLNHPKSVGLKGRNRKAQGNALMLCQHLNDESEPEA
jgi:hypothetical protein